MADVERAKQAEQAESNLRKAIIMADAGSEVARWEQESQTPPGRVLGAWAVVCIGVGSGLVAGFWPRR